MISPNEHIHVFVQRRIQINITEWHLQTQQTTYIRAFLFIRNNISNKCTPHLMTSTTTIYTWYTFTVLLTIIVYLTKRVEYQEVVIFIRLVELFAYGIDRPGSIRFLIYKNLPWSLDFTQKGSWSLDILARNLMNICFT